MPPSPGRGSASSPVGRRPAVQGHAVSAIRIFHVFIVEEVDATTRSDNDVQPTLGPDHGSQRKARRFCTGLQSRAMNHLTVATAPQVPHSGCSPRCPPALALQPPQSPPSRSSRPFTVAAAPDALSSPSPAASKPSQAAASPHSPPRVRYG